MSGNTYETGRLNLPFVGISTFGKRPYVGDWEAIDADIAVLGAPFDFGPQFRSGARFGPRAVREASTRDQSISGSAQSTRCEVSPRQPSDC